MGPAGQAARVAASHPAVFNPTAKAKECSDSEMKHRDI
jgi:hypothetical protein